jgi:transcriptional regulator with XRE-family HTH domain
LREDAGLTAEQVARRVNWSASKVSRIENAQTPPRTADLSKLLALYGVEDRVAEELLTLAREAGRKGWWEKYSSMLPPEYSVLIGTEAEAKLALSWAAQIVPGLLQTADYAHEAISGYLDQIAPVPPSEIRRRVEVRLERQRVLTRDNPLEFHAVLDQSVLYRRFGDRGVMNSQIKKLLELSERDTISLRILPLDGPHPIGTGAFVLFQFEKVRDIAQQDALYIENLTGGRYVEEEEEVFRYRRSFDRLSELALDNAKSREMLTAAFDAWK